jgi:hypothetical protein
LFCSACHGSPHAIQPTVQPNDNVQNIALQGFSGILRRCEVCHGYVPSGPGPHGYIPTTLNLTLLLEGLYNGTTMNMAQNATGNQWPGSISDQITVELHNSTSPYTLAVGPLAVGLNANGTASVSLPASLTSSYYIVIKHRNSIETWNGNPVSFSSGSVSYNFTSSAGQAFGSNLKQVSGKYVIYTGDVNQDGIINSLDITQIDNDALNFAKGYLSTDTNGDGVIDANDMNHSDNNAAVFIAKIVP